MPTVTIGFAWGGLDVSLVCLSPIMFHELCVHSCVCVCPWLDRFAYLRCWFVEHKRPVCDLFSTHNVNRTSNISQNYSQTAPTHLANNQIPSMRKPVRRTNATHTGRRTLQSVTAFSSASLISGNDRIRAATAPSTYTLETEVLMVSDEIAAFVSS